MTQAHIEAGSMTIELLLYIPGIAALIWLLLWAGTAGQAPGELSLAASDAARAAAATRDPSAREARVQQVVGERLADICEELAATMNREGQLIEVEVSCRMDTGPMQGLGLGARTFTATGLATIDRFIAEQPTP